MHACAFVWQSSVSDFAVSFIMQDGVMLRSFVSYFASELLAELWARAERARGNLADTKPDSSLRDAFNMCIGLASLIPVPGAAAAFVASCQIVKMVVAAINAYRSVKDAAGSDMMSQLASSVAALKAWREASRAANPATGVVDIVPDASTGPGATTMICCFIFTGAGVPALFC